MWSQPICPNCKGGHLWPGTLGPADRFYFRSEHTRFLRLGAADIEVAALLCLDCGQISLHAETSEAKSLTHAISAFAQRRLGVEGPNTRKAVSKSTDYHPIAANIPNSHR